MSDANADQFTIEAWIRVNSWASGNNIVAQYTNAGSYGWAFQIIGSDELRFASSADGSTFNVIIDTTGANLTTGVWYHVAVDKDATGKIRLYKDGSMFGSSTPADSSIFNASTGLAIGANGLNLANFNGWIDELRITKGTARYASDSGYDVPTEAFPDIVC